MSHSDSFLQNGVHFWAGSQEDHCSWVAADLLVVGGLMPSPRDVPSWTPLVVQWIRIFLPMGRTQVQFLVQEDPTYLGATKPVHPNDQARALQQSSHHKAKSMHPS